ncbi:MAG TPA: hypothetical protein VFL19_01320, partial [Nitrospira sp.]|nr:hypothetical protein [Nitrospira sp.]
MLYRLLQPLASFVFPGGLLFLVAVGFLRPQGLPAWCQAPVAGLPYLALGFGLLFGWYFGSTRMLLSLLTLTFANQAWATWPLEKDLTSASYTIFAAATFLLPLNFLAFSILKEEAIGTLRATLRLLLFLFQPFVVLWLCDPANRDMAAALTTPTGGWPRPSTPVPLPALLVFLISGVMHMVRFAIQRHPMDAGAAWALASAFLAYHGTQYGWHPTNFFA